MVQFACGLGHTAAIDNSGSLWTFGSNLVGQLGLEKQPSFLDSLWDKNEGKTTRQTRIPETYTPTKVESIHTEITFVGCGASHTCCVDINGDIWVFGSNEQGQLGLGNNLPQYYPKKLDFTFNIIEISCGKAHTVCLDNDSNVWSFGCNTDGQLGMGYNGIHQISSPQKIKELENIQKVKCGSFHTICLHYSGIAFSFGLNNKGQLGLENTTNKYSPQPINNFEEKIIIDLSCSTESTEFVLNNGHVYYCGAYNGEMGSPLKKREDIFDITSVASGVNHSLFLDSNGLVWSTATNHKCDLVKLPIRDICQIFVGGMNSFLLDSSQNIWTTGPNHTGQLGLGHNNNLSPNTLAQMDKKYNPYFGFTNLLRKSARK